MSAESLACAPGSTHEMLLRLLACETGLLRPAHPQAQYQALYEAYAALKKLAIENLEQELQVPIPGGASPAPRVARVSGQDDGLAFAQLFRGMELFIGPDTMVDDYAVDAVMRQWVLPLAGRLVEANPDLTEGVLLELVAHHGRHSPEVKARNINYLKTNFRFTDAFIGRLA